MITGQREEVQHCRYGARGILLPLSLEWRPRLLSRLSLPAGAVLVLLWGFLMRIVVILSSEGVYTR
jgi:hypothetical protein